MAHIQRRQGARGPTWRVRYTDPAGAERSRTFKKKALAEDFLTEVAHTVRSGFYVDPSAGLQTVESYLEEWRAQQAHHRPRTAEITRRRFAKMVYPHIGALRLGRVRPSTIRAWQASLVEAGYAPATIRGVRGQLAGAFLAAVSDRRIASSPFDGVKAPEVVRKTVVPLTVEQVRAGEAVMADRYRAVNVLVAGTGLRAGEVFGLTVDRLDLLRKTVRVDRQLAGRERGGAPVFGPPKTKASNRVVPLPERVVAELAAHLTRYPAKPGELVFRTARGGAVTRGVWIDAWRPAQAVMGLAPGQGLHQLRHFYASLLIASGRSVKEVQERLGHASAMETLDTYSHLFADSDEGTRAAIDAAFAAPEPAVENAAE